MTKQSKKSSQIAISVQNLHKSFRIPLDGGMNLKQKIVNVARGKKGYKDFSPLNGISFEVEKGDFFGIVGRNGSGKSTLLKTIAGIYTPEKGKITVNGILVPFIELGVGFNPELTGRENVFLNGALLGFSRDEMASMYDDIVEFAELEDFMDERLKNYSSGMQVRLAFSIAIRAEGDILLLDEVLAVGDEAFQRKCYDYFATLKSKKKTVILVTHSMSAVNRFCNKALFLNEGVIEYIGNPEEVAIRYSSLNDKRYNKSKEVKKVKHQPVIEEASDFELSIINPQTDTKEFKQGDWIEIKCSWEIKGVRYLGVALMHNDGRYLYGPNTYQDKEKKIELGKSHASIRMKLEVATGEYYIKAALFGRDDTDPLGNVRKGPSFTVSRAKDVPQYSGDVHLPHDWILR